MKTIGSILVLGMLALVCATVNADDHTSCVEECNKTYTPKFYACHGVVECENYVRREAASCINNCGEVH